jgi:hypothetical protein
MMPLVLRSEEQLHQKEEKPMKRILMLNGF